MGELSKGGERRRRGGRGRETNGRQESREEIIQQTSLRSKVPDEDQECVFRGFPNTFGEEVGWGGCL